MSGEQPRAMSTAEIDLLSTGCDINFARSADHSWLMAYSGSWPAMTTITISWGPVTITGFGSGVFRMQLLDESFSQINVYTYVYPSSPTNSQSQLLNDPHTTLYVRFYTDSYANDGVALNVQLSGGSCTGPGPCQYGTRVTDSTIELLILSAALLSALAIPAGMEWMIPIILSHAGAWVDIIQLCSTLPPPVQDISIDDWWQHDPVTGDVIAVAKVNNNLANLLWDKFCQ